MHIYILYYIYIYQSNHQHMWGRSYSLNPSGRAAGASVDTTGGNTCTTGFAKILGTTGATDVKIGHGHRECFIFFGTDDQWFDI